MSKVEPYWPEEIVGTGELVVYAQDYAILEAECAKLREECEYLANENIELKMLIKNMRQQFSTSTGQEAKDE